jgi:hypothetical protein
MDPRFSTFLWPRALRAWTIRPLTEQTRLIRGIYNMDSNDDDDDDDDDDYVFMQAKHHGINIFII